MSVNNSDKKWKRLQLIHLPDYGNSLKKGDNKYVPLRVIIMTSLLFPY